MNRVDTATMRALRSSRAGEVFVVARVVEVHLEGHAAEDVLEHQPVSVGAVRAAIVPHAEVAVTAFTDGPSPDPTGVGLMNLRDEIGIRSAEHEAFY